MISDPSGEHDMFSRIRSTKITYTLLLHYIKLKISKTYSQPRALTLDKCRLSWDVILFGETLKPFLRNSY